MVCRPPRAAIKNSSRRPAIPKHRRSRRFLRLRVCIPLCRGLGGNSLLWFFFFCCQKKWNRFFSTLRSRRTNPFCFFL